MQGHNLPPQYHLPPLSSVIAGAAAAGAGVAASISRTPSPTRCPSPAASSAPSTAGPIPGAFSPSSSYSRPAYHLPPPPERYGTQRKIRINVKEPRQQDEYPPVPPPPVPPKTPRAAVSPGVPPAPSPVPTSVLPEASTSPPTSPLRLAVEIPKADSRPSSSASSRAAVEDATNSGSPTSACRPPASPRKRRVKALRSPRALSSPRREKRERERERERDLRDRATPRARPSILNTLSVLLLPVRMVAWPLTAVLSPVVAHAVNAALLFAMLALVIFLAASRLRFLAAAFPFVADTALLPVRTLATPTCLLVNLWCPLSLLSDNTSTAQPFWRLFASPGNSVDVARVSRSLSSEVRVAKDIFDSLLSLGDGRMMEGLAHVRIHELGIAIQTGSTLDARFFIGQELIQLADTASSVADEIVRINAMSVSIFSWLFWEFSHIVKLLDLPDPSRPSPRTLKSRLDSLVSRLDADLDRLHQRVGHAIPVAERGAAQGWALHEHLSYIHSDLRAEHEKYPTWQRALEAGKKFFAGGDPSKLTRIARDLQITQSTIGGITETRNSLERVRIGLVAFRDQVRHFSASVMGLHLGADEAVGLGPAEELAILSTVVGELGSSVGRAKRAPGEDVPLLDAS